MFSKAFWQAAAERAVKTGLQALVAVTTVGGVLDLAAISWKATGAAVAVAMVGSLVTSLLSLGAGPEGSPSLVVDKAAGREYLPGREYG
jgi:hypothetical protein